MAVDNLKAIAALKAARDSGVKSVSVDGTNTTFASIAEMNSLIRQLEAEQGNTRRPVAYRMTLGGAW